MVVGVIRISTGLKIAIGANCILVIKWFLRVGQISGANIFVFSI